ncbi:MAG TPA: hypothetical protein VFZ73_17930, partial [Gemmatimonadaceae bacterium]
LDEIADAVRTLVRQARIVAEGAGAASLAVARSGRVPGQHIVCVVSGGNVDGSVLASILNGSSPHHSPENSRTTGNTALTAQRR